MTLPTEDDIKRLARHVESLFSPDFPPLEDEPQPSDPPADEPRAGASGALPLTIAPSPAAPDPEPTPEAIQRLMVTLGVTQEEVDATIEEGKRNAESGFEPVPFPGPSAVPEGVNPAAAEFEHYLEQHKARLTRQQAQQAASSGLLTGQAAGLSVESGETSSGLFNRPRNKCIAPTNAGEPCGAYKRRGSDYCPMHDPENAEAIREVRSKGGRSSVRHPDLVYLPPDFRDLDFNLLDSARMQGTMSAAMRMVLLGLLQPAQANTFIRFLNGAMRNLAVIKKEEELRRNDNVLQPSMEDHLDYAEALAELSSVASQVKARLDLEDRRRANNRVLEAANRRERVLLTNRKYGPARAEPRSPTIGFGPNNIRPFHG